MKTLALKIFFFRFTVLTIKTKSIDGFSENRHVFNDQC
jgi:hypothetical protein